MFGSRVASGLGLPLLLRGLVLRHVEQRLAGVHRCSVAFLAAFGELRIVQSTQLFLVRRLADRKGHQHSLFVRVELVSQVKQTVHKRARLFRASLWTPLSLGFLRALFLVGLLIRLDALVSHVGHAFSQHDPVRTLPVGEPVLCQSFLLRVLRRVRRPGHVIRQGVHYRELSWAELAVCNVRQPLVELLRCPACRQLIDQLCSRDLDQCVDCLRADAEIIGDGLLEYRPLIRTPLTVVADGGFDLGGLEGDPRHTARPFDFIDVIPSVIPLGQ